MKGNVCELYVHLQDEGACVRLCAELEWIGEFVRLKALHLSGIAQLPESIGRLTALRTLYLDNLVQLTTLPSTLGRSKACRS